MKFLKTGHLNKFAINNQTLIVYPKGVGTGNRVVFNADGGLMLPKGGTADRPKLTGVRQPTDANGTIRYNTDTNTIEAYINNVWTTVRAPGATAISTQTLGPGNAVETVFGPLTTVPTGTSYQASDNNIIVLVENVFQIGNGTNFDIEQSVSGSLTGPNAPYADGWYIKFTSAVDVGKDVTVYFGYAD
jgi:hypothetical protein